VWCVLVDEIYPFLHSALLGPSALHLHGRVVRRFECIGSHGKGRFSTSSTDGVNSYYKRSSPLIMLSET